MTFLHHNAAHVASSRPGRARSAVPTAKTRMRPYLAAALIGRIA